MEKDIEILESFIKQLEEYEDEEELKQAIENLINRVRELEQEEKELEHLLTSQLGFNLYRDYIPKFKIKEILGIEEQDKIDILDYLKIIVDEFNRLEDIEDKKVQIEYKKVFNKGVKSVENKIKEKIEEIEDGYADEVGLDIDAIYHNQFVVDCVEILQELLEEQEE